MADLYPITNWRMQVSTEEFHLISKGLRGCLRPDDVEAAKALINKITKDRVIELRKQTALLEKYLESE